MSIDPASLLAMAQIARVVIDVFGEQEKGELTQEGIDAAWSAIHGHASGARQRWEASKMAPGAQERRK